MKNFKPVFPPPLLPGEGKIFSRAFLSVFMLLVVMHVNCQVTHSVYSDTIGINTGDKSLADSLYSYAVSELGFLDYNDCNNCPLRAHVITFVLSMEFPEIKTGKVWLIADCKLSSRREHYKTHSREFLSGMEFCLQWGFHVAPVVIIGSDTLVIDPSTQSSPASLGRWAANISANTASYLIIKDRSYYSYPEDSRDLFDDTRITWDKKYIFISAGSEINFLAEKLTKAYHLIFDPLTFGNYRNKLNALAGRQ